MQIKNRIILLASLTILIFFFYQSSMSQYAKKIGSSYFVSSINQQAVLTAFTTEGKKDTLVYLALYDLQSGKQIKQKEIARNKKFEHEQIIGKMDTILWVYSDSLVGYDVNTLEPTITETTIAAKNPVLLNNFSEFHNSYLLDESAKVLYLRTKDDVGYKLYLDELRLIQDNSAADPPADPDYKYEFAAEYQINDRYSLEFALVNIDTFQNNLYILGSERETGQVTSYFGSQIYAPREESRLISILPYKDIEKPGTKEILYQSSKKYFKGGFLCEKFFARAWTNKKGEHIILFEQGKNLQIAMIDKNGKELWRVDSQNKAPQFFDYLIDDLHLAIWLRGNNTNKGDSLLSIQLQTGTSKILEYKN